MMELTFIVNETNEKIIVDVTDWDIDVDTQTYSYYTTREWDEHPTELSMSEYTLIKVMDDTLTYNAVKTLEKLGIEVHTWCSYKK